MKKFLVLLLIVMIFIGCDATEKRIYDNSKQALISWGNYIKFNDIVYAGNSYISDEVLSEILLGDEYDEVEFKIADVVFDPEYRLVNGDSTYYDIGSKVYEIIGYRPECRLAVVNGQDITIYEAFENQNAKTGKDIIDIEDKVKLISLNSEVDARTQLGVISDSELINDIVDVVLESPIVHSDKPDFSNRYFIEFHLYDGTNIIRNFLPESNIINYDIVIDNETKEKLLMCLE